MISIYASTDVLSNVEKAIASQLRLDELVATHDLFVKAPEYSARNLVVTSQEIRFPLDWYNIDPPYILPESFPFSEDNLLGCIYAKLGNMEKANGLLNATSPSFLGELGIIHRLRHGESVSPDELVSTLAPFDEYRLMHNQAILRHYSYGQASPNIEEVMYFYSEALSAAPSEEYKAFSANHLCLLLSDAMHLERAEGIAASALKLNISTDGNTTLTRTLCQIWLAGLTAPYDQIKLATLKQNLWSVLKAFEAADRNVDIALTLIDAGIIANYSESWSESLGYLNRAIQILESEELPELAANAQYRKGVLLFTWAKNGNPQFFRSAAEAFQEAVKIFTKDQVPEVFADIQHHLGMIYAEIPDEEKKKSIWAGLSSSAFHEALNIYSKDIYPYEHASVCNHYANALMHYPEAKLSNNVEKALFYYQEALNIRNPKDYPTERSLTLLNSLEAYWHLGLEEDRFDEERYDRMYATASEALILTTDERLIEDAQQHIGKLEMLKQAYI